MTDLEGKQAFETGADDGIDERDERPGQAPRDLASLRIATYNVHSCVGIDAKFSPERIAKVIRGLECDVVGLQEVGWHHRGEIGLDQFDFLARSTGMRAFPGPTKHNDRAHYGNALLTNLPVRSVRSLDLSVGNREPRGAIDADIEVGGSAVRVIAAHLGLDPWERNAQIGRILHAVEWSERRPTVFLGDLNEWRGRSPRIRRLHHTFPDCAAPRSFHARMPALRLDRIFVTDDLLLSGFEVVRTALTRQASDHLPVRAMIALKPG